MLATQWPGATVKDVQALFDEAKQTEREKIRKHASAKLMENAIFRSASPKSDVWRNLYQLKMPTLRVLCASDMHASGRSTAERADILDAVDDSMDDVRTDIVRRQLDAQPDLSKLQPDHASLFKAGLQQDGSHLFRLDDR